MACCTMEGDQIWLVTSQNGWMGVVGSSDMAGYQLEEWLAV
jgi:hypothetical protein